ncbi:MAG: hypothetical protein WCQ72_05465 [Eubacteriales bacterium]
MRLTMASIVRRENILRGNRRRRYPTSYKHIEQREPSAAYFDACEEYAARVNATLVRISHAGAAPLKAHRSKGKRESLRGRKTVGLSVLSDSYSFRKRKIIKKPFFEVRNPFRKRKTIDKAVRAGSQPVSQTKSCSTHIHNPIRTENLISVLT